MQEVLAEKTRKSRNGYEILLIMLVIMVLSVFLFGIIGPFAAIPAIVVFLCLKGFKVVDPNTARILLLFGAYRGTIRQSGLVWVNPFYATTVVSLRARNFESEQIKVNDKLGNPILISIMLVWRVEDTYKTIFEVYDYVNFIRVQTDSAVRTLAASYPYDHFEDERAAITLSTNFNEVNATLEKEIRDRLTISGIEVVEARITHLSYAPEIAQSMLRRQQAVAVVAARHKIVEGAVSMVESALQLLSAKQIVNLDEEKKAAMVSNLMVVLCGDKESQPVVNTGTLNH